MKTKTDSALVVFFATTFPEGRQRIDFPKPGAGWAVTYFDTLDGDDIVNETGVTQPEAAVGPRTDSNNFHADLDVSSHIDEADVSRVRAKLGGSMLSR